MRFGKVRIRILGWVPFRDLSRRRKEVWGLARSELQNKIGKVGLFQNKPKCGKKSCLLRRLTARQRLLCSCKDWPKG